MIYWSSDTASTCTVCVVMRTTAVQVLDLRKIIVLFCVQGVRLPNLVTLLLVLGLGCSSRREQILITKNGRGKQIGGKNNKVSLRAITLKM